MNPDDDAGQEKRITFQLYNYWYGLANNYGIPPLKALTPSDIAPYKRNMALIDLRDPQTEPTLQVIGQYLNNDIDLEALDQPLKYISDIPRHTRLSRITDHYMEVLANRLPISFDAEFITKTHDKILYRAILLPFSDDGTTIDFILGAIRWISEKDKIAETPPMIAGTTSHSSLDTEENFSLLNSLEQCRNIVQGKNPLKIRSRKSLYKALSHVLEFHEQCLSHPKQYAEILQAHNLRKQKRAPFTPTLKLCFGHDYDKTRLTEYAAALSFAQKNNQNGHSLPDFFDLMPGGIKGCVKAERKGRKDNNKSPNQTKIQTIKSPAIDYCPKIENMPPIASFQINDQDIIDLPKFNLILARRDGTRMDVLKILNENNDLLTTILEEMNLPS